MLVAFDFHDDVLPLLKKVRNHEFGRNPFTVISVIIECDNNQQLEGAMKPGAYDVMTAPLAPPGVMDSLERIVKRLPFIAMPNYMGPDGRREEQRKMKVPVFDVLNTLKDKIEGKTYT